MLSSFVFLILQILGALIAPLVFVPVEFRPPLSATPGVLDIGLILVLATFGAVFLIILKFIIPLRILSHLVVMFSGFYLGSFFGTMYGIVLGTFNILLRLSNNIWFNNLATAITAIAFGLLIGYFVDPGFSLLLIAALSVYDAIGVLYSKHIQAIWLAKVRKEGERIKITKSKSFGHFSSEDQPSSWGNSSSFQLTRIQPATKCEGSSSSWYAFYRRGLYLRLGLSTGTKPNLAPLFFLMSGTFIKRGIRLTPTKNKVRAP
jgi:hypothetical protein